MPRANHLLLAARGEPFAASSMAFDAAAKRHKPTSDAGIVPPEKLARSLRIQS